MREITAISYIILIMSFAISGFFSGERKIKAAIWWQVVVFLETIFYFFIFFDPIYNRGITVDNRELQIIYKVTFSWMPILALMRLRRLLTMKR